MKFRDLYNLIEEHPPCHQVIERELETIANSNRALWDAFLTVLPRIAPQALLPLRQKYAKVADEKLAVLTNHKTSISTTFAIDFDEQYNKFYKEDPEFQRQQEHFQLLLQQTEARTLLGSTRLQTDPKTVPYFYEYESVRVSDAPKGEADPTDANAGVAGENDGADTQMQQQAVQGQAVDLVVVCPSTCTSAASLARLSLGLHRHCDSESFRVYLSVANDGDPGAHLYLMSLRLAEEVKGVLKGLQSKGAVLRSLSFVGFGTGGLIIRGALKELKDYKARFGAFLTLGTPHIGNAEVKENFIGKGRYELPSWRIFCQNVFWWK